MTKTGDDHLDHAQTDVWSRLVDNDELQGSVFKASPAPLDIGAQIGTGKAREVIGGDQLQVRRGKQVLAA
jgi:hypothetical protein